MTQEYMTSEQMAREFHEALDIPQDYHPKLIDMDRLRLRLRLILEEVTELVCAMTGQTELQTEFHQKTMDIWIEQLINEGSARDIDLVKIADGCVDSHVVISGTAIEYGLPEDEVYEEVHRTNMAKVDGPIREDGKRLKPEGWEPPDIAGILAEHAEPTD